MLEHLQPRDAELLQQLGVACQFLTRSTQLLGQLFGDRGDDDERYVLAIHESDRAAHDLARDVDMHVFRAFTLPVDRMEFHALAAALDSTVDAVERTARHAAALHASGAPEPLRALAGQLTCAVMALAAAVPHVRDAPAEVELRTGEVRRAVDAGEAEFEAGLSALFAGAPHAIDVVRWKDLYERVRHALAHCARAADALHQLTDHAAA